MTPQEKARKKVFFDLFDQLPKDIAIRAKRNYDPNFHTISDPKKAKEAVQCGFDWEESIEGSTYWCAVWDGKYGSLNMYLASRKEKIRKQIKELQKTLEKL